MRDFRTMTATIANEDLTLREMAPLALNHSRGTQLKSYFRKRTHEKNTLTRHVRRVLGDDDEDDAAEVSAAVDEMEADDEVTAASENDNYDPIDSPHLTLMIGLESKWKMMGVGLMTITLY